MSYRCRYGVGFKHGVQDRLGTSVQQVASLNTL